MRIRLSILKSRVGDTSTAKNEVNQSIRLMSATGRKGTLISVVFGVPERPLLRKADIQPEDCEIGSTNDRFTPGSGHSGNIAVNDR